MEFLTTMVLIMLQMFLDTYDVTSGMSSASTTAEIVTTSIASDYSNVMETSSTATSRTLSILQEDSVWSTLITSYPKSDSTSHTHIKASADLSSVSFATITQNIELLAATDNPVQVATEYSSTLSGIVNYQNVYSNKETDLFTRHTGTDFSSNVPVTLTTTVDTLVSDMFGESNQYSIFTNEYSYIQSLNSFAITDDTSIEQTLNNLNTVMESVHISHSADGVSSLIDDSIYTPLVISSSIITDQLHSTLYMSEHRNDDTMTSDNMALLTSDHVSIINDDSVLMSSMSSAIHLSSVHAHEKTSSLVSTGGDNMVDYDSTAGFHSNTFKTAQMESFKSTLATLQSSEPILTGPRSESSKINTDSLMMTSLLSGNDLSERSTISQVPSDLLRSQTPELYGIQDSILTSFDSEFYSSSRFDETNTNLETSKMLTSLEMPKTELLDLPETLITNSMNQESTIYKNTISQNKDRPSLTTDKYSPQTSMDEQTINPSATFTSSFNGAKASSWVKQMHVSFSDRTSGESDWNDQYTTTILDQSLTMSYYQTNSMVSTDILNSYESSAVHLKSSYEEEFISKSDSLTVDSSNVHVFAISSQFIKHPQTDYSSNVQLTSKRLLDTSVSDVFGNSDQHSLYSNEYSYVQSLNIFGIMDVASSEQTIYNADILSETLYSPNVIPHSTGGVSTSLTGSYPTHMSAVKTMSAYGVTEYLTESVYLSEETLILSPGDGWTIEYASTYSPDVSLNQATYDTSNSNEYSSEFSSTNVEGGSISNNLNENIALRSSMLTQIIPQVDDTKTTSMFLESQHISFIEVRNDYSMSSAIVYSETSSLLTNSQTEITPTASLPSDYGHGSDHYHTVTEQSTLENTETVRDITDLSSSYSAHYTFTGTTANSLHFETSSLYVDIEQGQTSVQYISEFKVLFDTSNMINTMDSKVYSSTTQNRPMSENALVGSSGYDAFQYSTYHLLQVSDHNKNHPTTQTSTAFQVQDDIETQVVPLNNDSVIQLSASNSYSVSQLSASNSGSVTQLSASNSDSVTQLPSLNSDSATQLSALNSDSVTQLSASNSGSVAQLSISNSDSVSQLPALNSDSVTQLSASNSYSVTQLSASNSGSVSQLSASNSDSLTQFSASNSDSLTQLSASNSDSVTQLSASNSYSVTQMSASNSYSVTQLSASNSGSVSQLSASNSDSLTQFSASNSDSLTQLSASNSDSVTQLSASNSYSVTQMSASNSDSVTQLSASNSDSVSQLSASNSDSVRQVSASNSYSMLQLSASNSDYVTQLSASNSDAVSQLSASNSGSVSQLSAWNSNSVTQLSASNSDSVTQLSASNSDSVTQLPALNSDSVTQLSASNSNSVTQLSASNSDSMTQLSAWNSDSMAQLSASDSDSVTQLSASNSDSVTQLSSSNSDSVSQLSASNTDSVSQLSASNSDSVSQLSASNSYSVSQLSASNSDSVIQLSASNSYSVSQLSASNSDSVSQLSASNSYSVTQLPASNSDSLTQLSASNSDSVIQLSSSNSDYVTQLSASNSYSVSQLSASYTDSVSQLSASNTDSVSQLSASNSDSVIQLSLSNSYSVSQLSASNSDSVTQLSASNSDSVTQLSASNSDSVIQLSASNSYSMAQLSASNSDSVIQLSASNSDYVTQLSALKSDSVTQLPASNSDSVTQLSASNSDSVTQLPASNSDSVTQLPASNSYSVTQLPALNSDSMTQFSASNSDSVTQLPASNSYSVTQLPASNSYSVSQLSASNSDSVTQLSASKSDSVSQLSASYTDSVSQLSVSNTDSVSQLSASNSDSVIQLSLSNSYSVSQLSASNSDSVTQLSASNSDSVIQLSASNSYSMAQLSASNSDSVTQLSASNSDYVTQLSALKSDSVTQLSASNSDSVTQLSASNSDSVTQLPASNSYCMTQLPALNSDSMTQLPALNSDSMTQFSASNSDSVTQLPASNSYSVTQLPALKSDSMTQFSASNSDSVTQLPASNSYSVTQLSASNSDSVIQLPASNSYSMTQLPALNSDSMTQFSASTSDSVTQLSALKESSLLSTNDGVSSSVESMMVDNSYSMLMLTTNSLKSTTYHMSQTQSTIQVPTDFSDEYDLSTYEETYVRDWIRTSNDLILDGTWEGVLSTSSRNDDVSTGQSLTSHVEYITRETSKHTVIFTPHPEDNKMEATLSFNTWERNLLSDSYDDSGSAFGVTTFFTKTEKPVDTESIYIPASSHNSEITDSTKLHLSTMKIQSSFSTQSELFDVPHQASKPTLDTQTFSTVHYHSAMYAENSVNDFSSLTPTYISYANTNEMQIMPSFVYSSSNVNDDVISTRGLYASHYVNSNEKFTTVSNNVEELTDVSSYKTTEISASRDKSSQYHDTNGLSSEHLNIASTQVMDSGSQDNYLSSIHTEADVLSSSFIEDQPIIGYEVSSPSVIIESTPSSHSHHLTDKIQDMTVTTEPNDGYSNNGNKLLIADMKVASIQHELSSGSLNINMEYSRHSDNEKKLSLFKLDTSSLMLNDMQIQSSEQDMNSLLPSSSVALLGEMYTTEPRQTNWYNTNQKQPSDGLLSVDSHKTSATKYVVPVTSLPSILSSTDTSTYQNQNEESDSTVTIEEMSASLSQKSVSEQHDMAYSTKQTNAESKDMISDVENSLGDSFLLDSSQNTLNSVNTIDETSHTESVISNFVLTLTNIIDSSLKSFQRIWQTYESSKQTSNINVLEILSTSPLEDTGDSNIAKSYADDSGMSTSIGDSTYSSAKSSGENTILKDSYARTFETTSSQIRISSSVINENEENVFQSSYSYSAETLFANSKKTPIIDSGSALPQMTSIDDTIQTRSEEYQTPTIPKQPSVIVTSPIGHTTEAIKSTPVTQKISLGDSVNDKLVPATATEKERSDKLGMTNNFASTHSMSKSASTKVASFYESNTFSDSISAFDISSPGNTKSMKEDGIYIYGASSLTIMDTTSSSNDMSSKSSLEQIDPGKITLSMIQSTSRALYGSSTSLPTELDTSVNHPSSYDNSLHETYEGSTIETNLPKRSSVSTAGPDEISNGMLLFTLPDTDLATSKGSAISDRRSVISVPFSQRHTASMSSTYISVKEFASQTLRTSDISNMNSISIMIDDLHNQQTSSHDSLRKSTNIILTSTNHMESKTLNRNTQDWSSEPRSEYSQISAELLTLNVDENSLQRTSITSSTMLLNTETSYVPKHSSSHLIIGPDIVTTTLPDSHDLKTSIHHATETQSQLTIRPTATQNENDFHIVGSGSGFNPDTDTKQLFTESDKSIMPEHLSPSFSFKGVQSLESLSNTELATSDTPLFSYDISLAELCTALQDIEISSMSTYSSMYNLNSDDSAHVLVTSMAMKTYFHEESTALKDSNFLTLKTPSYIKQISSSVINEHKQTLPRSSKSSKANILLAASVNIKQKVIIDSGSTLTPVTSASNTEATCTDTHQTQAMPQQASAIVTSPIIQTTEVIDSESVRGKMTKEISIDNSVNDNSVHVIQKTTTIKELSESDQISKNENVVTKQSSRKGHVMKLSSFHQTDESPDSVSALRISTRISRATSSKGDNSINLSETSSTITSDITSASGKSSKSSLGQIYSDENTLPTLQSTSRNLYGSSVSLHTESHASESRPTGHASSIYDSLVSLTKESVYNDHQVSTEMTESTSPSDDQYVNLQASESNIITNLQKSQKTSTVLETSSVLINTISDPLSLRSNAGSTVRFKRDIKLDSRDISVNDKTIAPHSIHSSYLESTSSTYDMVLDRSYVNPSNTFLSATALIKNEPSNLNTYTDSADDSYVISSFQDEMKSWHHHSSEDLDIGLTDTTQYKSSGTHGSATSILTLKPTIPWLSEENSLFQKNELHISITTSFVTSTDLTNKASNVKDNSYSVKKEDIDAISTTAPLYSQVVSNDESVISSYAQTMEFPKLSSVQHPSKVNSLNSISKTDYSANSLGVNEQSDSRTSTFGLESSMPYISETSQVGYSLPSVKSTVDNSFQEASMTNIFQTLLSNVENKPMKTTTNTAHSETEENSVQPLTKSNSENSGAQNDFWTSFSNSFTQSLADMHTNWNNMHLSQTESTTFDIDEVAMSTLQDLQSTDSYSRHLLDSSLTTPEDGSLVQREKTSTVLKQNLASQVLQSQILIDESLQQTLSKETMELTSDNSGLLTTDIVEQRLQSSTYDFSKLNNNDISTTNLEFYSQRTVSISEKQILEEISKTISESIQDMHSSSLTRTPSIEGTHMEIDAYSTTFKETEHQTRHYPSSIKFSQHLNNDGVSDSSNSKNIQYSLSASSWQSQSYMLPEVQTNRNTMNLDSSFHIEKELTTFQNVRSSESQSIGDTSTSAAKYSVAHISGLSVSGEVTPTSHPKDINNDLSTSQPIQHSFTVKENMEASDGNSEMSMHGFSSQLFGSFASDVIPGSTDIYSFSKTINQENHETITLSSGKYSFYTAYRYKSLTSGEVDGTSTVNAIQTDQFPQSESNLKDSTQNQFYSAKAYSNTISHSYLENNDASLSTGIYQMSSSTSIQGNTEIVSSYQNSVHSQLYLESSQKTIALTHLSEFSTTILRTSITNEHIASPSLEQIESLSPNDPRHLDSSSYGKVHESESAFGSTYDHSMLPSILLSSSSTKDEGLLDSFYMTDYSNNFDIMSDIQTSKQTTTSKMKDLTQAGIIGLASGIYQTQSTVFSLTNNNALNTFGSLQNEFNIGSSDIAIATYVKPLDISASSYKLDIAPSENSFHQQTQTSHQEVRSTHMPPFESLPQPLTTLNDLFLETSSESNGIHNDLSIMSKQNKLNTLNINQITVETLTSNGVVSNPTEERTMSTNVHSDYSYSGNLPGSSKTLTTDSKLPLSSELIQTLLEQNTENNLLTSLFTHEQGQHTGSSSSDSLDAILKGVTEDVTIETQTSKSEAIPVSSLMDTNIDDFGESETTALYSNLDDTFDSTAADFENSFSSVRTDTNGIPVYLSKQSNTQQHTITDTMDNSFHIASSDSDFRETKSTETLRETQLNITLASHSFYSSSTADKATPKTSSHGANLEHLESNYIGHKIHDSSFTEGVNSLSAVTGTSQKFIDASSLDKSLNDISLTSNIPSSMELKSDAKFQTKDVSYDNYMQPSYDTDAIKSTMFQVDDTIKASYLRENTGYLDSLYPSYSLLTKNSLNEQSYSSSYEIDSIYSGSTDITYSINPTPSQQGVSRDDQSQTLSIGTRVKSIIMTTTQLNLPINTEYQLRQTFGTPSENPSIMPVSSLDLDSSDNSLLNEVNDATSTISSGTKNIIDQTFLNKQSLETLFNSDSQVANSYHMESETLKHTQLTEQPHGMLESSTVGAGVSFWHNPSMQTPGTLFLSVNTATSSISSFNTMDRSLTVSNELSNDEDLQFSSTSKEMVIEMLSSLVTQSNPSESQIVHSISASDMINIVTPSFSSESFEKQKQSPSLAISSEKTYALSQTNPYTTASTEEGHQTEMFSMTFLPPLLNLSSSEIPQTLSETIVLSSQGQTETLHEIHTNWKMTSETTTLQMNEKLSSTAHDARSVYSYFTNLDGSIVPTTETKHTTQHDGGKSISKETFTTFLAQRTESEEAQLNTPVKETLQKTEQTTTILSSLDNIGMRSDRPFSTQTSQLLDSVSTLDVTPFLTGTYDASFTQENENTQIMKSEYIEDNAYLSSAEGGETSYSVTDPLDIHITQSQNIFVSTSILPKDIYAKQTTSSTFSIETSKPATHVESETNWASMQSNQRYSSPLLVTSTMVKSMLNLMDTMASKLEEHQTRTHSLTTTTTTMQSGESLFSNTQSSQETTPPHLHVTTARSNDDISSLIGGNIKQSITLLSSENMGHSDHTVPFTTVPLTTSHSTPEVDTLLMSSFGIDQSTPLSQMNSVYSPLSFVPDATSSIYLSSSSSGSSSDIQLRSSEVPESTVRIQETKPTSITDPTANSLSGSSSQLDSATTMTLLTSTDTMRTSSIPNPTANHLSVTNSQLDSATTNTLLTSTDTMRTSSITDPTANSLSGSSSQLDSATTITLLTSTDTMRTSSITDPTADSLSGSSSHLDSATTNTLPTSTDAMRTSSITDPTANSLSGSSSQLDSATTITLPTSTDAMRTSSITDPTANSLSGSSSQLDFATTNTLLTSTDTMRTSSITDPTADSLSGSSSHLDSATTNTLLTSTYAMRTSSITDPTANSLSVSNSQLDSATTNTLLASTDTMRTSSITDSTANSLSGSSSHLDSATTNTLPTSTDVMITSSITDPTANSLSGSSSHLDAATTSTLPTSTDAMRTSSITDPTANSLSGSSSQLDSATTNTLLTSTYAMRTSSITDSTANSLSGSSSHLDSATTNTLPTSTDAMRTSSITDPTANSLSGSSSQLDSATTITLPTSTDAMRTSSITDPTANSLSGSSSQLDFATTNTLLTLTDTMRTSSITDPTANSLSGSSSHLDSATTNTLLTSTDAMRTSSITDPTANHLSVTNLQLDSATTNTLLTSTVAMRTSSITDPTANHLSVTNSQLDSATTNTLLTSTVTMTTTKAPRKCKCPCKKVPSAKAASQAKVEEEIKNFAETITKEIKVEKTSLSSQVRKKTSARDERASSKFIGTLASMVLVGLGIVLLINDIHSVIIRSKANKVSPAEIKKRKESEKKKKKKGKDKYKV